MKIVLCGASGRMGREIAREIENSSDMELVAGVDKLPHALKCAYYPQISDVKESADVIVDFSHHDGTYDLVDFAKSKRIPLVIATTGQTESEKEYIVKASKEVPVFFCGNMSLGVTLFISTVAKIAGVFPYADVEIIETHHNKKADAPSGTALMLASAIIEARGGKGNVVTGSRQGVRQKGDIGISSVRIGGVVGVHEVRINTGYQSFTLKHEAHSRALFAVGTMHAIRFIVTKPNGLYSVKDFL